MVVLNLRCLTGEFGQFEVKFDTGFNGELALPTSVLENLKKSLANSYVVRFANGVGHTVHAYSIEAMIDGETREMVALDLSDGSLLLGMKALPYWTGSVEFKVNGDVNLQNLQ